MKTHQPVLGIGGPRDTGTMGATGDQMPGDEMEKAENIAAIISYIRKVFGGGARLVRPNEVAAIREQVARHKENFTAYELKSIPEEQSSTKLYETTSPL